MKRPGRGAHLYEALGRGVAVIGVAKSRFVKAEPVEPVLRGRSRSPLYVSVSRLTGWAGLFRLSWNLWQIGTEGDRRRADGVPAAVACLDVVVPSQGLLALALRPA